METKEQIVYKFATKRKEQTFNLLKKKFPVLQTEDCEDIFQDAIIIFCNKLSDGEEINASLYTYFVGICKIKALEFCRKRKNAPELRDEFTEKDFSDEKIDFIIGLDTDYDELKTNIVSEFVKEIPEPCNTIFRCCFYHNLSLKTIAEMQNKEVGAVKTSKSRCLKKFRIKFTEILKSLTNN